MGVLQIRQILRTFIYVLDITSLSINTARDKFNELISRYLHWIFINTGVWKSTKFCEILLDLSLKGENSHKIKNMHFPAKLGSLTLHTCLELNPLRIT